MPSWTLAIDYGTTHTAAAVQIDGKVEQLEFPDGQRRIHSPVWIGDDGTVYVGPSAQSQRVLAPERYVREPKSKLGRADVETIAGTDYPVAKLVGAVLSTVVADACRRYGGSPTQVRLTHPAEWGDLRKGALVAAAAAGGINDPVLVPEPEAAAFALARNLAPGERLAVYDLGGGTFDTAVLERTEQGFDLRGSPGGKEVGGERFDDRLLDHVGRTVSHDDPEGWEALLAQRSAATARDATNLRNEIRVAKEELSRYESQRVIVPFDQIDSVLVQRSELEELIEKDVDETFELLEITVSEAGSRTDDLQGVYLTGGSSRIRLVEDLARRRYGERVFTNNDPKAVVASGALAWRKAESAPTVIEPPPPPPLPAEEAITPDPPVSLDQESWIVSRLVTPGSPTLNVALVVIFLLFAAGSFAPFVDRAALVGSDSLTHGPNYWTYNETAPFYLLFSGLTFCLPLAGLLVARMDQPIGRRRLLLIALMAAASSWNLVDIPALKEQEFSIGVGSMLIELGACSSLLLALLITVFATRAASGSIDQQGARMVVLLAGVGALVGIAGLAVGWDEKFTTYKVYFAVAFLLPIAVATPLMRSQPSARALPALVFGVALSAWWAIPAGYFFAEGVDPGLEGFLYAASALVLFTALGVALSDKLRQTDN